MQKKTCHTHRSHVPSFKRAKTRGNHDDEQKARGRGGGYAQPSSSGDSATHFPDLCCCCSLELVLRCLADAFLKGRGRRIRFAQYRVKRHAQPRCNFPHQRWRLLCRDLPRPRSHHRLQLHRSLQNRSVTHSHQPTPLAPPPPSHPPPQASTMEFTSTV